MNDIRPDPDASYAHPAPPPHRPLSGWAVLSLVLALIGVVVGLFTWLWWVALVPLALGIGVLVGVSPRERRGRILAVFALILALFSGPCVYVLNNQMRGSVARATTAILGALDSTSGDEAQQRALERWLYKPALERGVVDTLRQRHAALTERFGRFAPPVEAGSLFGGVVALVSPPEGVVEVPEDAAAKPPAVGHTMWAQASFGSQRVYVALELMDGGGTQDAFDVGRQAGADGVYTQFFSLLNLYADLRF